MIIIYYKLLIKPSELLVCGSGFQLISKHNKLLKTRVVWSQGEISFLMSYSHSQSWQPIVLVSVLRLFLDFRAFRVAGPHAWNSLPVTIQEIKSIHVLKNS